MSRNPLFLSLLGPAAITVRCINEQLEYRLKRARLPRRFFLFSPTHHYRYASTRIHPIVSAKQRGEKKKPSEGRTSLTFIAHMCGSDPDIVLDIEWERPSCRRVTRRTCFASLQLRAAH
jgi:hypothetical protein